MTPPTTGRDARQLLTPEMIREALESLYLNMALANSTLAGSGLFVLPETSTMERAQVLRHRLLGAIEALRPLRPSASAEPGERRSYEILTLRYVAGFPVPDVAEQLSLGTRQVYRDLRRAEDELAALLVAQLPISPDMEKSEAHGLQHEIDALAGTHQMVDLTVALKEALAVLQPLIHAKGLGLDFQQGTQAAWVPLAPGVVREVLIQLLSATMQQASAGERVVLRVTQQTSRVEIRVTLSSHPLDPQQVLLSQAMRMARSLGSLLMIPETQQGDLILTVTTLPLQPILVIEDNPGARILYERYLEGSRWRVVAVKRLSDIVEIAASIRPAVVILDILMAEVDGWTMLQVLKTDPIMAGIPVIVCSVINDPELARALGASASLVKPLSRLDLLATLERVTIGHSEA